MQATLSFLSFASLFHERWWDNKGHSKYACSKKEEKEELTKFFFFTENSFGQNGRDEKREAISCRCRYRRVASPSEDVETKMAPKSKGRICSCHCWLSRSCCWPQATIYYSRRVSYELDWVVQRRCVMKPKRQHVNGGMNGSWKRKLIGVKSMEQFIGGAVTSRSMLLCTCRWRYFWCVRRDMHQHSI